MVHTPSIPPTWEAEVGGLCSKACVGKSTKPYLKQINIPKS
jgi:hypothetical protein